MCAHLKGPCDGETTKLICYGDQECDREVVLVEHVYRHGCWMGLLRGTNPEGTAVAVYSA